MIGGSGLVHLRFLFASLLAMLLCLGVGPAASQPPLAATPGRVLSSELAWGPREARVQEQALQAGLAQLAEQTPGTADVFVLAAGLWSDHVFLNEAAEGASVLAERFGAQSRTLVLANGPGAVERGLPAATPAHLARALAGIGERMDSSEDVLVLFITSHGVQGQGAVFFETGRLQAVLSPTALARNLDEAGVRNRIVIVSACFAGAFIEPLQDDRTIVLTAAASDRTSFGCEPEREWTWFGDAFLNVALRGSAPLLRAFDTAKLTIQGWEARQGARPSRPAAHVGAEMAAQLPRLEQPQRPRN